MNKIFSFVVILAAITTSCSYTDLSPTDMVGSKEAFKDVTAVEGALIGAYARVSLRPILQLTDYVGDDATQGGEAGGAGTDSFQWNYTASKGDHAGVWDHLYRIINQANQIIINSSHLVDAEGLDNCIGQALFLRAYAHFDLLRIFSYFDDEENLGIPYVSKAHALGLPGRDKVGYCFDAISNDLDRALNLIEANAPSNVAFASKAAVYAMKARVALYRGTYVHARVYANEAISLVPLAKKEDYTLIWQDKTTDGVIWKLPRSPGEETLGTIFYGADNSNVFGPSKKFQECFDKDNDIRLSAFTKIGPDRAGAMVDVIKKYEGTASNVGLSDNKLLRSAEMQLIIIECYLMENNLTEANNSLNQLRHLRINNWANKAYNAEELKLELLLERRRELAYEGHRLFDARRLGQNLVRDNDTELEYSDYRMVMPIPQAEIEANINISTQQNLNY